MSEARSRLSWFWRSERIPMVTLSKSISMAALGAWAGGSNEELPRSLPEIGWFTALSVQSPNLASILACHFPASGKRKGAEEANPGREMDVVADWSFRAAADLLFAPLSRGGVRLGHPGPHTPRNTRARRIPDFRRRRRSKISR